MAWLFSFLLTHAAFASQVSASCVQITADQLPSHIPAEQEVLAFSSWCGACRSHLQQAAQTDIVLGVLDEPERLQAAFQSLNITNKCLIDKDGSVAKVLRISSVPKRFSNRK